jgi:hypothetical protein
VGYTHYWYRPQELDAEPFADWANDIQTLIEKTPTLVREPDYQMFGFYPTERTRLKPLGIYGPLGEGDPQIGPERVAFNGGPRELDLDHETFHVNRVFDDRGFGSDDERGWFFDFCKTNHKPYDRVVCAALIRLAFHFPEAVRIESDGVASEWEPGLELCREVFGVAVMPFGDESVVAN